MNTRQNIYITLLKRPIGFLGALIALVLTSPITVLTAICLHFANKGAGAFFYQERPGKGEKVFKIIKFKTMTDERDADGNLLPDKDRITKIGSIIRKTSIDELPQLINILKGEMAFIGPRPLLVEYLPYYTAEEKKRHTIRPGISGWAQVHGRNNLSWNDKLALDVYYVDHISLKTDILVLIKTIQNVFTGKDVNVVPSLKGGKLSDERASQKQ